MKKILILCFVCLSTLSKAQSNLCPALQAFTGEWRYVNGQDTIRIYLRANDYAINGPSAVAIGKLWGWHEYKRGNTIIESNYSNRFMTLPANSGNVVETSYSISLQMPQCDINRHRLIGNLADLSQCRESKPVIISFNAAQTQLTWSQRSRTGFGYGTGCYGMTFPRTFVLIKQ
jgi:hypothetical protein